MSTRTFELDTLRILLNVIDEATSLPKDLTNASVIAVVKRTGSIAFDAGATIINAIEGQIQIEFQPETFTPSTYLIQVRVTDASGDTQTVYNDSITAARSLRVGQGS